MSHLRRALHLGLLAGAVAISPIVLYEFVQKSSEILPPRPGMLRLGVRAEAETLWRPRTGIAVVDHVVHEWKESQRFYTLARRRMNEPRHR